MTILMREEEKEMIEMQYDWKSDDFIALLKEQGQDPKFVKAFIKWRKEMDVIQKEIDKMNSEN